MPTRPTNSNDNIILRSSGTLRMPDLTAFYANSFQPLETTSYDCAMCHKKKKPSPKYRSSIYGRVCKACFESLTQRCFGCEQSAKRQDLTLKVINHDEDTEELFCSTCITSNFYICYRCEEEYYRGERIGREVRLNDSGQVDNRCAPITLCSSCFEDDFINCMNCGRVEREYLRSGGRCGICENYFCRQCRHNSSACRRGFRMNFHEGNSEESKYLTVNRFIGVEIEAERGDQGRLKNIPNDVGVGTDGSLRDNGIEVRTPPASLSKAEEIISATADSMKAAGFRGTKRAGLHIHVDLRDIQNSDEKVGNLIKTVYAIEDLIYSMIPPSRWANTYCLPLNRRYMFEEFKRVNKLLKENTPLDEIWYKDSKENSSIRKVHHHDQTRYFGLNVHSIFYRGTAEFRYHSGTTNKHKILNWAEILLCIVDYAINNFDDDQIKRLLDMPTSAEKLILFFKTFNIPDEQAAYMNERIGLFNPDFKVKFNKGIMDDANKKSVEELLEELMPQYYDKAVEYLSGARWMPLDNVEHVFSKEIENIQRKMAMQEIERIQGNSIGKQFLSERDITELVTLARGHNVPGEDEEF